jgi:hypothetical protein
LGYGLLEVPKRRAFQGVAIVNESEVNASLTFRAYGVDGNLLAQKGMTNPNTFPSLPARTQYVKLANEMFGLGEYGGDHGWIDVESTTANTGGFFRLSCALCNELFAVHHWCMLIAT